MPVIPPRKPQAGMLAYRFVLLILVVVFGIYALPDSSGDATTLTRGPTAAPALLPETPAPLPAASPAGDPDPSSAAIPRTAATGQPAAAYVINTNTRRFHLPDCASVSEMKAENRQNTVCTREELIEQGCLPCGRCHP